jgi:hypothetical protein
MISCYLNFFKNVLILTSYTLLDVLIINFNYEINDIYFIWG